MFKNNTQKISPMKSLWYAAAVNMQCLYALCTCSSYFNIVVIRHPTKNEVTNSI